MSTTESQQMYLKTIHNIGKKKGTVRKIDIAEELNISKPSVTNGINRLIKDGLARTDANNSVFLTEEGRAKAEKIVKRYDAFVSMLRYMDMPDAEAKDAACKLEHAIDDNTFAYITAWVEKKGSSN